MTRCASRSGAGSGRRAVCLAQSARHVQSWGAHDPSAAAEWVRRYGAEGRVAFLRGNPRGATATRQFALAVGGGAYDLDGLRPEVGFASEALEPGGLIAVHGYPDPEWPDVRRAVDEHASRFGWERVKQTDYLGVFRVPPR
jgi:hypothetical protein